MALNLVKLCVGVDSVEQLQGWLDRHDGQPTVHTTRMTPKRKDEILAGGSLYWVIKRVIQVRQPVLDLEEFTDPEGVKRCNIWLENKLVRTAPSPRRAFQGWRYLQSEDAPRDVKVQSVKTGNGKEPPPELGAKLAELGLL